MSNDSALLVVRFRSFRAFSKGRESGGRLKNEPSHEVMVLFAFRTLILQTRLRSHPVGLDVWFLVRPFVCFHTLCVRTAKAVARLRGCAGSPESSLVAYVISTIISWAGSNNYNVFLLALNIKRLSYTNCMKNYSSIKHPPNLYKTPTSSTLFPPVHHSQTIHHTFTKIPHHLQKHPPHIHKTTTSSS